MEKDPDNKRPWSSFLVTLRFVSAVLVSVFVLTTLLLLTRNWASVCPVPLNVFVLVGACLLLASECFLFLALHRLDKLSRAMFLLSCVLIVGWSILGIVWLVESSLQNCATSNPPLFGLTIAFVVLSFAPALLFIVFLLFQFAAEALVHKRIISGFGAFLLTGKRIKSQFLGVSVLGNKGVGKTSILQKLVEFNDELFPKKENGGKCRIIDENPSRFSVKMNRITFVEECSNRTTDLETSDCVLILFSIADRRSFHRAKLYWFAHAVAHSRVPILLVGTKNTNLAKNVVFRNSEIGPNVVLMNNEVETPLKSLSSSIWIRIFGYLDNLTLIRIQSVCLQFRDLGRHEYCWTDRDPGEVKQSEIDAWRTEISESKVLENSGFVNVSYLRVSCEKKKDMLRLWKETLRLVRLNESKILVAKSSRGMLEFSKYH